MAFCVSPSLTATMGKSNHFVPRFQSPRRKIQRFQSLQPRALFNPFEDPIVKEALKEPVAFASGVCAGLLRLDLNDDPLKEWLTTTVEASGITKEELDTQSSNVEEVAPQQIEIE
ncbi:hypothetical protein ACLOJK_017066 [Asimina triloba]